jgi:4-diphosphocytidyl-2-C-methyl-D-erythritol kinase
MGVPLCALAPAKINLGLFVGPLRGDGRHELATVMQSISLADELVLEAAPGADSGEGAVDEVLCPGLDLGAGENLAALALARFRAATGWDGPAVRLRIEKRVPVAGGLAGGSADAAAALRLAAAASGLAAEGSLLLELAASLGADVPAQVRPGRWLAGGAGERLEELPCGCPLGVLVLPVAAELGTAAVYALADRLRPPRSREELDELREGLRVALTRERALPPAELLCNDLEAAARSLCPAIDRALAEVRAAGCDRALVSGSGPTVLGLFEGDEGPERARAAADALRGRVPAAVAAEPVDATFGAPRGDGGRGGCQNPGGSAA